MKIKLLKIGVTGLLITMMGIMIIGCGNKESYTFKISISGSTSVGPLVGKLAEAYKVKNDEVIIEINETGSSAGIKDVSNGVANLGMSSRDLKDKEKESVEATAIAYDGIAIIINKDNKLKNLTKEQIKGIYTGKYTNWSQVGGENAPIVVVSREEGSGTRAAFEEIIGYKSEELLKEAQIADGSGNIKINIKGNKNAIGFVSFEYLDDSINALKIDGIDPTAENVRSKQYLLSRSFLIINKKDDISKKSNEFIDFILSDEGQQIVADNKAIKLK